MARKRGPKPVRPDDPALFTHRCKGARMKFREEVVRTVLTFLLMHERSWRAAQAKYAGKSHGVPANIAAGLARKCRELGDGAAALQAEAVETWSAYEWQAAADEVDTLLRQAGWTGTRPDATGG